MSEFILKIMEMLKACIPEEYSIKKNNVIKNNDIILNAVSIQKKGDNLVKNIYLEQYYQMYKNGLALEDIVSQILKEATENRAFIDIKKSKEVLKNIWNYEKIKDRIIFKLLNKGMNVNYLKDKLYRDYLDMAEVFHITIEMTDNNVMATTLISKELLSKWNVSVDEIYKQSLKNMQMLLPERISPIEKILDLNEEDNYNRQVSSFYVLSNIYMNNGAAAMLYEDVLKLFSEEQGTDEVIIIPSSVEEVILIPKLGKNDISEKKCSELLSEVNNIIEEEIVLSNNIYIYNHTDNKVKIWNEQ